jgi:hypothetical protein
MMRRTASGGNESRRVATLRILRNLSPRRTARRGWVLHKHGPTGVRDCCMTTSLCCMEITLMSKSSVITAFRVLSVVLICSMISEYM